MILRKQKKFKCAYCGDFEKGYNPEEVRTWFCRKCKKPLDKRIRELKIK